MLRTWIAAILFTAGASVPAYAQISEPEQVWGQAGFMWAIPEGEFGDQFDGTPIGAGVLFGGRVLDLPLFLGTELAYLNYGIDERLDLYNLEDVPVQAVRTQSSYNIAMGHLVARLQVPAGPIQPFVDVLGGVKHFATRSSIDSDVIIFAEGLSHREFVRDWALSYGAGVGVDLRLFEGRLGPGNQRASVALSGAVRYLFGSKASYVTSGVFDEEMGRFVFDVRRSRTDMIIPQIGITIDV